MICHKYLRQWLNIPVCGTFEILQWNKGRYGQEILDIISKHMLCHLTFQQCLKGFIIEDIRNLHNVTSEKSNIQYNTFQTTKAALKMIREKKTAKLESLEFLGTVTKEIWKTTLPKVNDAWFKAQHRLPKNIYSLL